MRQAELLEATRRASAEFEELAGSLSPRDRTTPGAGDLLSVKDLLAHTAAWARLCAGWFTDDAAGQPVVRFAPGFELEPEMIAMDVSRVTDRLNHDIFVRNRGLSFDEALAEFREAMELLEGTIRSLDDAALADSERFTWLGRPAWQTIAGNGHEHIEEHLRDIRAWLEG